VISVILPTFNDEARLVACLSPLIPAAMEGFVRELIVIDAGSTDRTLEIADDAGAVILKREGDAAARYAEGAKAAKGPWLLLLDPAVRLEYGWEAAAQAHLNGPRGPGRFRLRKSEGGLLAAFQPCREIAMLILKGGGDSGFGNGVGLDRIGQRNHGRLLQATGWL